MGNITLPPITDLQLDNGIMLHMLMSGSQEVNQLTIAWPGGTNEADVVQTAIMAALLKREGAAGKDSAQISEALDFRGAMLEIGASEHYTIYKLSTVNSMAEGVLPVIRDIISEPEFPEHAFQVCKNCQEKSHLLQMSKVNYLSKIEAERMVMGRDNRCVRFSPIEQIQAITLDDVREFSNRVTGVPGTPVNIDNGIHAFLCGYLTDSIRADAIRLLESLPTPAQRVDLRIEPFVAEEPRRVDIVRPDAMQCGISCTLPAISRFNPDYIKLNFTVRALGGYFGSRLMTNIREDKGYTYGIDSNLLGMRDGSLMIINAQADSRYVDAVIEEIRHEMAMLAQKPLDADEMLRLKQSIQSMLMDGLDNPFTIMNFYSSPILLNFPPGYFESQLETCRTLTPDDIVEMARKYLHPDQLRIAVAGNIS